MKSESYNPRLKKLLIEVVENQLRDNDPPITRETLQRLLAAGYTKSQAKEKIASVVIGHIYDAMHDGIPFDGTKYEAELRGLK